MGKHMEWYVIVTHGHGRCVGYEGPFPTERDAHDCVNESADEFGYFELRPVPAFPGSAVGFNGSYIVPFVAAERVVVIDHANLHRLPFDTGL